MMGRVIVLTVALIGWLCSPAAAETCGPGFVLLGGRCVEIAAPARHHHALRRAWPPQAPTAADATAKYAGPALKPFRTYLAAAAIPPAGVGAYGLFAAHGKPTAPERARFTMACNAFLAYLAPQPGPGESVPLADQLLTIWPLDAPTAPEALADKCDFLLDHYDLSAADDALADAARQGGQFKGDGPFLIGWSPADTRGKPDKLVMVVDMSGYNTQERFDYGFRFWKQNIIDHPELFRRGWDIEGVRQSIRDFADHYGTDILRAAHLIDGSSAPSAP